MNGVNRVFLIGNLTRDAELAYTKNQKPVAKFGMAMNESKDRVTFLDVNLWGKAAESVNQYLKKGKQVWVEGSIEIQSWEKDGVKKSKAVINSYTIQLMSGADKQDHKHVAQSIADSVPF